MQAGPLHAKRGREAERRRARAVMAYYIHQKDRSHKAIVTGLEAAGKATFDTSPLSDLGFDIVAHGAIQVVEDMQRANMVINAAINGSEYQAGMLALAMVARQFLRQYEAGDMAIGFLPMELKNPEPPTRTYRSTKRNLKDKATRHLTASEVKARSRAPIPCISSIEEALSYF